MKEETIYKIRKNPLVHNYLKEHSYYYKDLYRDDSFYNELEKKAKEYYQVRLTDKIERLQDKINLINTIISVIK